MSEHQLQAALFKWANMHLATYPELRWLYAIPNGGHRYIGVARKLKAEGVKAGVPDIHLPVPRGKYCGFYGELKFKTNKPTKAQQEWLAGLAGVGHYCCVEKEWLAMWWKIECYLNLKQGQELT